MKTLKVRKERTGISTELKEQNKTTIKQEYCIL